MFYEQRNAKACVAADVMVIPDVPGGGRDSYMIWEEGQVPAVVFEMTSESTCKDDQGRKKDLYVRLRVREYWLFDPKGEWIKEPLVGYRLSAGVYLPIRDYCSSVLGLRLAIGGAVIGFYHLDTGEKLFNPDDQK